MVSDLVNDEWESILLNQEGGAVCERLRREVRDTAMNPRSRELIEDVSAAEAAYLWNILPQIAALPGREGFERLRDIFRTAFLAYFGALGWVNSGAE